MKEKRSARERDAETTHLIRITLPLLRQLSFRVRSTALSSAIAALEAEDLHLQHRWN